MNLLACFGRGALVVSVAVSFCSAQQWQQSATSPKGSGITDLAVKQSNGYLFATTGSFNWPNADTGGVHRSTDGGTTWTRVFAAFAGRMVAVKPDGIVFASVQVLPTQSERLYYSTDNGDSWNQTYDSGLNNNVFSIAFDPTLAQRVWSTTRTSLIRNISGGTSGTWEHLAPPGLGLWVRDVAVQQSIGRVIIAVQSPFNPNSNAVYYSDLPGSTGWAIVPGITAPDTINAIIVVRDTLPGNVVVDELYAGTVKGRIYKAVVTTPFTFSLVYEVAGNPDIAAFGLTSLGSAPNVIWAATWFAEGGPGGGVFRSTDRGASWQEVAAGLPSDRRMRALASHKTSANTATLYSGMFLGQNDGAPVYRLDVVTSIESANPGIPREYALEQNYPNPFNPSTTISYEVPSASHVELAVFDVLGRKVTTLVDEVMAPGKYEVRWTAAGHTSGVYFYRFQTRDFVSTKKLVLLR